MVAIDEYSAVRGVIFRSAKESHSTMSWPTSAWRRSSSRSRPAGIATAGLESPRRLIQQLLLPGIRAASDRPRSALPATPQAQSSPSASRRSSVSFSASCSARTGCHGTAPNRISRPVPNSGYTSHVSAHAIGCGAIVLTCRLETLPTWQPSDRKRCGTLSLKRRRAVVPWRNDRCAVERPSDVISLYTSLSKVTRNDAAVSTELAAALACCLRSPACYRRNAITEN